MVQILLFNEYFLLRLRHTAIGYRQAVQCEGVRVGVGEV